jgi:Arc/MetJ-type ribon-helix-helix transcriptional regulator
MEDNIVRVSLNLPVRTVRILDELVQMGAFLDRTEAIRHILREYCLRPNAPAAAAEPQRRSWRKRSIDDMMVQVSFALPKLVAAQLEKWARAGLYPSRYAATQAIIVHYAPKVLEQYRNMASGSWCGGAGT